MIAQGGVQCVNACDYTGWCTDTIGDSSLKVGWVADHVTCHASGGKNKKNCFSRCRKLLLKSPFFYTGFEGKMNAELNDVDSKVF